MTAQICPVPWLFAAPCRGLHSVRAAERKCLSDAQDFPYISVDLAAPHIKVWVESVQIGGNGI